MHYTYSFNTIHVKSFLIFYFAFEYQHILQKNFFLHILTPNILFIILISHFLHFITIFHFSITNLKFPLTRLLHYRRHMKMTAWIQSHIFSVLEILFFLQYKLIINSYCYYFCYKFINY